MPIRLPRARAAPLPALTEFLAPFTVHFVQRPSARVLERYVTGLLTDHPTHAHPNAPPVPQLSAAPMTKQY
jgi:hypothetical protein